MKRVILILLLALTLVPVAQARPARPPWLPKLWYGIAMCEEGSTYGSRMWKVKGSTYSGAFGFANSTWATYAPDGYPANAGDATPWQQYQVALNVAFQGNSNRRYGHHAGVGLTAWGSFRNGCYRNYI